VLLENTLLLLNVDKSTRYSLYCTIMANIRKSITFTEPLNDWIQSLIASGEYTNESEYIRDLIRQDRKQNSKLQHLRTAIQEGIDSGVSTKSLDQIFEEKKNQMIADGRL